MKIEEVSVGRPVLTDGPLIRLALRASHLLPQGEKGFPTKSSRLDGLLLLHKGRRCPRGG